MGLSQRPPVVSTFYFIFFSFQVYREMERGRGGGGGVQTAEEGGRGGNRKGKENAFNLFTVTALCWFQQNGLCAEYFSFLKDPPLYTEH